MNNSIKILFLILNILTGLNELAANSVTVTYIANDGYLFSDGTHKIIVDCMFQQTSHKWYGPLRSVREKMVAGEKPFDDIDAIIVTHAHSDHFEPDLVGEYLSRFQSTLIAPPQAVERLSGPVKGNILAAPAEYYQSRELKVGELKITVQTLYHVGGNRRAQNMVVHIDFNGLTILHAGDANLDDLYNASFPETDIVMLSFWQGFDNEIMEKIKKNLNPKHVIFKHTPYKDIAETDQKIEDNYGRVSTDYTLFSGTYETIKYEKNNNRIEKKLIQPAPFLAHPLKARTFSAGQKFRIMIPEDTFTMFSASGKLVYSLAEIDRKIPSSIQFDQEQKIIYGEIQSEQSVNIRIIAKAPSGAFSYDTLELTFK